MIRFIDSRFSGSCRICYARHEERDVIGMHSDPSGDIGAVCRVCAKLLASISPVDLCAPYGVQR